MDLQNINTSETDFQTHHNRIIRAAMFVAQGALLLRQHSADLLSCRDATRIREISDGLQQLVPALNRIGRATEPGELQ